MMFFNIRGSVSLWLAIFSASALPLVLLFTGLDAGRLGPDPAKTLIHETGIWALNFLVLCLSMRPMALYLKMPQLVSYRRQFGLWCYFYACIHLTMFYLFLLDADFARLGKELAERPYITVGFGAWLVFSVMAITSIPALIRKMGGRRWRRLHKIVFLAMTLVLIHYVWLSRSDVAGAVGYGVVLGGLVAMRLYYDVETARVFMRRFLIKPFFKQS